MLDAFSYSTLIRLKLWWLYSLYFSVKLHYWYSSSINLNFNLNFKSIWKLFSDVVLFYQDHQKSNESLQSESPAEQPPAWDCLFVRSLLFVACCQAVLWLFCQKSWPANQDRRKQHYRLVMKRWRRFDWAEPLNWDWTWRESILKETYIRPNQF